MQDSTRNVSKQARDQIAWNRIADLVYEIKVQDKAIHHEAFNHERHQLRSQVPRIKLLLGEQKCPEMSFQTIVQIKKFIENVMKFTSFVLLANTFDQAQSALLLQIAVESVQLISKYVDQSYMQNIVKQLDRFKQTLCENVRLHIIQVEKDKNSQRKLQNKEKQVVQLEKFPVQTDSSEEEQNNKFLYSTIKQANAEEIQQDELFEDISILKTCIDDAVQYLSIEQLEEIIEEIKDTITKISHEYVERQMKMNQTEAPMCILQDRQEIIMQNNDKTRQDDFCFDELNYQLQKQYQLLEYNQLHANALKYLQMHSITYEQLLANQISQNFIVFETQFIQDNNFRILVNNILNQRFYTLGTNKFDNYFVLFLVKLFGKSFKMVQNENTLMNIMYQLLHHKDISNFFVCFIVEQLFNQRIIFDDFSFKKYLPEFKQCFTIDKTIGQQDSN